MIAWILGGARFNVRQRSRFRRRTENFGAVSRPEAHEYFLRVREPLGRRTISHQLHEFGMSY